jgi:hypothetical protein
VRVPIPYLYTAPLAGYFDNHLIIWLPFLDTYRTMCAAPNPAFRHILERIRDLRVAA